jgi:hypothetical protein
MSVILKNSLYAASFQPCHHCVANLQCCLLHVGSFYNKSRRVSLSTQVFSLSKSLALHSGVALVVTDVSEEHIASIIRVKVISKLGTTLAVMSN